MSTVETVIKDLKEVLAGVPAYAPISTKDLVSRLATRYGSDTKPIFKLVNTIAPGYLGVRKGTPFNAYGHTNYPNLWFDPLTVAGELPPLEAEPVRKQTASPESKSPYASALESVLKKLDTIECLVSKPILLTTGEVSEPDQSQDTKNYNGLWLHACKKIEILEAKLNTYEDEDGNPIF